MQLVKWLKINCLNYLLTSPFIQFQCLKRRTWLEIICVPSCFLRWTRHSLPWLEATGFEFWTFATSAQIGSVLLLIKEAQEINLNCLYSLLLIFVQSFDSTLPTLSARFDGKGNRLLFKPREDLSVVYNVLTDQDQRPAADGVTDKVQLTAPGYSSESLRSSCFAGDDDELVVAPSSDHRLFIWSVPEGRGDRTIDQSLLSLTGHQHDVKAVRFCKATSTLTSGDIAGVIKLWTSSTSL